MKGPIDSGHLDSVSSLVRSVMPAHTVYAEPWFREGEIFFRKIPSRRELLNDPDERIVNFYMTVRTNWKELLFLIESTLYSETLLQLAEDIFSGRENMNKLYKAWAIWLHYNRERVNRNAWIMETSVWLASNREEPIAAGKVNKALATRLENALIVNRDPHEFINSADSAETFFYFRPADRKEAAALISLLPKIRGSFCFWYPDRRVAEKVAESCSLNRISDETGTTVFTNFKIQKTLFDK